MSFLFNLFVDQLLLGGGRDLDVVKVTVTIFTNAELHSHIATPGPGFMQEFYRLCCFPPSSL